MEKIRWGGHVDYLHIAYQHPDAVSQAAVLLGSNGHPRHTVARSVPYALRSARVLGPLR